MYTISIDGNFRDQRTIEWAGTGRCDPSTGNIECAADLGDAVYDAIAAQLAAGQTTGEVTAPGPGWDVTYSWEIERRADAADA